LKKAVFLVVGFVSAHSYRVFKPAPSLKPRQQPKIHAPPRYIIYVNALSGDKIRIGNPRSISTYPSYIKDINNILRPPHAVKYFTVSLPFFYRQGHFHPLRILPFTSVYFYLPFLRFLLPVHRFRSSGRRLWLIGRGGTLPFLYLFFTAFPISVPRCHFCTPSSEARAVTSQCPNRLPHMSLLQAWRPDARARPRIAHSQ